MGPGRDRYSPAFSRLRITPLPPVVVARWHLPVNVAACPPNVSEDPLLVVNACVTAVSRGDVAVPVIGLVPFRNTTEQPETSADVGHDASFPGGGGYRAAGEGDRAFGRHVHEFAGEDVLDPRHASEARASDFEVDTLRGCFEDEVACSCASCFDRCFRFDRLCFGRPGCAFFGTVGGVEDTCAAGAFRDALIGVCSPFVRRRRCSLRIPPYREPLGPEFAKVLWNGSSLLSLTDRRRSLPLIWACGRGPRFVFMRAPARSVIFEPVIKKICVMFSSCWLGVAQRPMRSPRRRESEPRREDSWFDRRRLPNGRSARWR